MRNGQVDLPEVEAARRWIAERLAGCRISAVEVVVPRVLPGVPRAEVVDRFLDRPLDRVQRHGRTLLLEMGGSVLALAPRGDAWIAVGLDADPPAGVKLALGFETGARLWFCDPGSAARAALWPAGTPPAAGGGVLSSGVEPLSAAFTLGNFKRILTRKKRTLYQLLVDDELIAGIGGIYADEILFDARLRPTRVIPSLKPDDVRLLYYSIPEVLQKATRFGGISAEGGGLIEGQPGVFQRFLRVHGRSGEVCPACRAHVRHTIIGEARTWFCPRCQR